MFDYASAGESVMEYQAFLDTKLQTVNPSGFDVDPLSLNSHLLPFQRDVVKIALKMGRFSAWERYGLGKALQALEWCNQVHLHTNEPTLILTPLAVAKQMIREAEKFGIPNVHLCRDNKHVKNGINVINYDSLHKLDCSQFIGVACDEVSSLRSDDSQRFEQVIESFKNTPYKTGWSATPCPNDFEEIGSQSEFMGLMPKSEMLSTYFTHDTGESQRWILMAWAENRFWQWVSQWAVYIRKPSDLNPVYDDSLYQLPAHREHSIVVDTPVPAPSGKLFFDAAKTRQEINYVNKLSVADRCQAAVSLANANDDQWIVWCWTNDESKRLTAMIDGAVEVKGSDSRTHKETAIESFQNGNIRVLVTKPTIAGYGCNLQNCHNAVFVGLDDRWEAIEQAIHRTLRFGQTHEVNTYYVSHQLCSSTAANHDRKSQQFDHMTKQLVSAMQSVDYSKVQSLSRQYDDYTPTQLIQLPSWLAA